MFKYDFHSHTAKCSRCAKQTTQENINNALKNGISFLAITDHNKVESIDDAILLTKNLNVSIIPGIEITTRVYNLHPEISSALTLHVLGLGIRHKDFNQELIVHENSEYPLIANYLKEVGYDINVDKCISFIDILEEMIANKYCRDRNDNSVENAPLPLIKTIFQDLKINEKFPKETITLKQTIDHIHELGGIAIWAHPTRGSHSRVITLDEIKLILPKLVELGLDGLEVFHFSNYDNDAVEELYRLAKRYDLLITTGSDNHNNDNPYFKFEYDERMSIEAKKVLNKI